MLPGFRYDKTEMDTNVYKYTNTDINYWKRLLHSCQSTWDKNCVFKLAFLGFQLINLTNAKGKSY
jgi:phenylalanine-4-hydroxylase